MVVVMTVLPMSGMFVAVRTAAFFLVVCGHLFRRWMLMMVMVHTRLTELFRNPYTFSFRTLRPV